MELGSGRAAAYCGKLLADLGARVVLVEPPGGHPLRTQGPSLPGAAHSGLFAHLALNKESLVISAGLETGRRRLDALREEADILITDGTTEIERALPGVLPETLIRVDLSPYGRTGRYADWKASDLTTWAMGGYMYFTGEKARAPLAVPAGQADLHCGVQGALAALAALYEQRRSGYGQEIEVSALESVLSAHSWLTVAWSHAGMVLDRSTHDLIRCEDGWVSFMQPVRYPNLFILIDRPEMLDDPRWADAMGWAASNKEIYGEVAAWCSGRTRREVVQAAQELRIACLPVNDASDLGASEQLQAREWWLDVEDPALGRTRLPGFPYRLTESPARASTPAPVLGGAPGAAGDGRPTLARRLPAEGAAPKGLPLAGIRVVEVTSNWAGPVCGRHFGDLGADVIKVEAPMRPATRQGQWPKSDPQRQPYNRSGYFNQMNRNKRDVVLDLAADAGKQAFIQLIRQADVLIENNSSRVMPNLGLGYEELHKLNPRLIMLSISGLGATGPERDFLAFGSNIEASCGLASMVGYDDSQPYRTGFYYADPVSGAHGAVAALAALEYRRRTGKGQWIDLSLNECAAGFFAEALIDYQLTGAVRGRSGNRDERYAPQGAYRCAGMDNWMALSVQSDDEWSALSRVIGRDDMGDGPSFATLAGRRAGHDEIDAAIGAWAASLEQYEACQALQRAGVAAAPVLANWQILADPHLFERGFYVHMEHPVVGVYPFPGWPWRFSRTPAAITRPAPLFGEHNRAVLQEAGLDDGQVAALYREGVTSDVPRL
jgi:crotonobetainyl-CoA:carnitine CoA-transferase CaiB-like acyl-CoA transferase